VDGQDVFAVYEAAGEAVARARRGEGPSFIEAQTYRYYGNFEGDTIRYRTKAEEDFYRSRDCLQRFRSAVLEQGLLSEAELEAVDRRAANVIEEAVLFALQSPLPAPADTTTDVYVSYPETQLWPFREAAATLTR
jgi:acetoin:2,6-dichlorophenolindophenol oxidoreductase subunit alpha